MIVFRQTCDTASSIYRDALSIRKEVFIEEQQVPASLEVDELEDRTIHVVGYIEKEPAVTARLLPLADKKLKVQRVAVRKKFRGGRYGQALMREVERVAAADGFFVLKLGAQNHAIPFYEKLGFVISSPEYEEAGILHHDMQKVLHPLK